MEEEIGQRFKRRLQTLTEACRRYNNSPQFRQMTTEARQIIKSARWPLTNVTFSYCPVQKTASTTLKRLFQSTEKMLNKQGFSKSSNETGTEKEVKFFFVREPYSRLLSGYVDKLYCPNTLFWASVGRYIIKNFRDNASEKSLRCGHDVTFPEFIRYVIHSQKTGLHRNGHFIPAHDHCDVCHMNYNYIGTLETLNEDMPYLLKVIQLPVTLTKSFPTSTISNNAAWVLSRMKAKIQKCMSMHEACLRLWKKWHIRGLISKEEKLPVTPQQAETVSLSAFLNLSLLALDRSASNEGRKLQKTEALREAFSSVPLEDRRQIQKLLSLDFALFGYDSSLESVFPSAPPEGADDYSYFDLNVQ